ncbi:hypothetical protein CEXT_558991 [Caerostris extrusa]|uniref:WW domain-containing protein n=1 Tax=Caerostris extrusa TaxID=172846 RepID=A0AAV4TF53_CAEEX|nr:hypothetical protein CEXT_558991 [Caerostris extrusa]
MLTANTENNLNQTHGLKSSDTEDSFPGIDNGNARINLPTFQALCSCDSSVQKPGASVVSEKLAGSTKYERHSCDESAESDCLPSGWERHEDDSGPYYWHISSGTIQRDPPISYSCNRVSSRLSKRSRFEFFKKNIYF